MRRPSEHATLDLYCGACAFGGLRPPEAACQRSAFRQTERDISESRTPQYEFRRTIIQLRRSSIEELPSTFASSPSYNGRQRVKKGNKTFFCENDVSAAMHSPRPKVFRNALTAHLTHCTLDYFTSFRTYYTVI